MIKKKFRSTFKGWNSEKITFPESFVKIWHDLSLPPPIKISQFFLMYDEPGVAEREFEKYSGADCTTDAEIKVYDMLGNLINTWTLGGVQVKIKDVSEGFDGIVADWEVTYSNVEMK